MGGVGFTPLHVAASHLGDHGSGVTELIEHRVLREVGLATWPAPLPGPWPGGIEKMSREGEFTQGFGCLGIWGGWGVRGCASGAHGPWWLALGFGRYELN